MNPTPEIATPLVEPSNPPILEGLDFGGEAKAANNYHYRKIGRLPKPLRDLINSMMDDSRTYAEIIRALNQSTNPPLPYSISEMNLSNWKGRGYRHYLAQQERMDVFQLHRESAGEIVANNDTALLPEATLQMVASQYFDVLGSFSLDSLKAKFAEDPLKYTRFLSVFIRASHEIRALKKQREAAAKLAAAEMEKLDPDRELNNKENELLVKRFDKTFKIRHPKQDPPAPASTQSEGLKEISRGSESAQTPGSPPVIAPHPEGMPDSGPIGAPPPATNPPGPNSTPELTASSEPAPPVPIPPELCPKCQHILPPLMPDGQRPFPACWFCSARLNPPGTEFCPNCHDPLPPLQANGERPYPDCRLCGHLLSVKPPVLPPNPQT